MWNRFGLIPSKELGIISNWHAWAFNMSCHFYLNRIELEIAVKTQELKTLTHNNLLT